MMKDYFLALIGGQLFALGKDSVAGIGIHNDSRAKLLEDNGKKYLPLPDGNQAIFCDLQQVMPGGESRRSKQSHYLIVTHEGQYLALLMTGKGRLFMADETEQHPLPPALTGVSRKLISGVFVNCNDLILLLNAPSLLKAPDWVVSRECC